MTTIMKAIKTCPFCGCERVVIDHEDDRQYYYHCPECEYDFSDEDVEHEHKFGLDEVEAVADFICQE